MSHFAGMPTSSAEQLRTRARALRQLAARVSVCTGLTLHQRAGDDTWIGPTASRCRDDLLTVRRELLTAHDELIAAARRLERQATELEVAHSASARLT
jgi:hypothetical protein